MLSPVWVSDIGEFFTIANHIGKMSSTAGIARPPRKAFDAQS